MSQIALLGAIEIGLFYGLVALVVFLSFRVLSFPDLTVDGSFPLGAAVTASAIVGGIDPYLATGCAIVAGALAGLVTAMLNVRFRILHVFDILDGLISREQAWFDTAGVARQLESHRPGATDPIDQ